MSDSGSSNNPSSYVRDFEKPITSREFVGYADAKGPMGTVLHCIANKRIFCQEKDEANNRRPAPTFMVVSIAREGWYKSQWKKAGKGAPKGAGTGLPEGQPLFDGVVKESKGGSSVITSVKGYMFERIGKDGRGARDDSNVFELTVGMAFRYNFSTYAYEDKKDGARMLPANMEYMEAYSMLEVVVFPNAVNPEHPGYAIKIGQIRPLGHSLHSYLYPLGLPLLPVGPDEASALAQRIKESCPCAAIQLDGEGCFFFSKAHPSTRILPAGEGFFRLKVDGQDGMVVPGLSEVDVRMEELVRFTNCGRELGVALFMVGVAAARGALGLLVLRDRYFANHGGDRLEYRAIPLVDPDVFLSFVDTSVAVGTDPDVQFDIGDVCGLEGLTATVSVAPVELEGEPVECRDFCLQAETVKAARAYKVAFGDSVKDDIAVMYYAPVAGPGSKRARGGSSVDFYSLSGMRC